jgi:hypothetical protein
MRSAGGDGDSDQRTLVPLPCTVTTRPADLQMSIACRSESRLMPAPQ